MEMHLRISEHLSEIRLPEWSEAGVIWAWKDQNHLILGSNPSPIFSTVKNFYLWRPLQHVAFMFWGLYIIPIWKCLSTTCKVFFMAELCPRHIAKTWNAALIAEMVSTVALSFLFSIPFSLVEVENPFNWDAFWTDWKLIWSSVIETSFIKHWKEITASI